MRGIYRITCCWPGLTRLWFQGNIVALATAVAFAALLNAILFVTFVRPDGVPGSWYLVGWAAVAGFWSVGLWQTIRYPVEPEDSGSPRNPQDLFIQAQAEYLKGHWVEARALLEPWIRRHPRDIESHLLLASVFRRTGQGDHACRQLRRVERLEGADTWHPEIEREREMLDRLASASD